MEKPDGEGYVNIKWPSKNVPHGGIFHTRIARPTEDQQQFLKVLLEESKLNLKLRQNRSYGLRSGDSERESASAVGSRTPASASAPAQTVRPRTSRRRSLSAIRSSGILDIDTYDTKFQLSSQRFRPSKRGEDRERMIEQLAHTMAYGDSPEQKPPPPPKRVQQKPAPKLPTNKETWNDLVTQIRERAEWLAEMEWLGHAAPHREIVEEQIAERMRALDALGVDSVCSSARSTARSPQGPTLPSPHSTVRSAGTEKPVHSAGKNTVKKSPHIPSGRKPKTTEENVMAYSKMSPLRYSPRRRV